MRQPWPRNLARSESPAGCYATDSLLLNYFSPWSAMTSSATETPCSENLLALDAAAQELLFTVARTANTFSAEPVSDEQLRAITSLAKWPPTMANTNPLRILFVRTREGNDRLGPLMSEGNRAKTKSAPAVAVLAAQRRNGREVRYTVQPERLEAAARAMTAAAAQWNARLHAIKRIAEAEYRDGQLDDHAE
jgi:hypothetical protein